MSQIGFSQGIIAYNEEVQKEKQNPNYKLMFNKKFATYLLKWQAGSIVTIPLMFLLIDHWHLNYYLAVLIFNFIGAIIFYPIDLYIFKQDKKSIVNDLYPSSKLADPVKQEYVNAHIQSLRDEALDEVAEPKWSEAKKYCDWRAKVAPNIQSIWQNLDINTRLAFYYGAKNEALREED